jgi:DNA-directed RNA polymerase II subunit RPB2
MEDMKKLLSRQINEGKKSFTLDSLIKHDTITKGLRSALATGNWGKDKQGGV